MSLDFVKLNVTGAAPVLTYASTASTGGTLADSTTYFYRVSAIMAAGADGAVFETLAVAQGAGQAVSSGTATNTVTITWTAVPGATGYRVYGRLTGAAKLIATLGNVLTFTDTGATAYPLSATVVPVASTFLAGNAFLPGGSGSTGSFVGLSPASPDLRTPIASTAPSPFLAGRTVVVSNPTAGSITLNLSPDNVTFGGTGYTAIVLPTLSYTKVTLPNYTYASAAGAYAISD
jgi:hypothetical protein